MAARRRTSYRRPARRRYPVRRRRRAMTEAQRRLLNLAVAALVALAAVLWLAHQASTHPVIATQAGAVLVLLLLATGAIWWALRAAQVRRAREQQLQQLEEQAHQAMLRQRQLRHIGVFQAMDPKEFEEALAELCRRDGCTQVRVVGGAGDLGADVIALTPQGQCIVLQAKRYGPRTKVGSQAVQVVNGTYQHHGGELAAIVTTSVFTKAARDYAAMVGIALLDADGLAGWAGQTGPPPWQHPTGAAAAV